MPKNTKSTKTTKTRTKVKGLRRSEQELSSEEAKKVRGGMDPTNARLQSPTLQSPLLNVAKITQKV